MFSLDFFYKKQIPPEHVHEVKWWSFNLEETFDRLSSSDKGMTEILVKKKKEKFGFNILPRKESRGLKEMALEQLKSSMILVLIGAVLISLILGDQLDAAVIALALIINIIFSFWQEYKTSRALLFLQKIVLNRSRVLRNGAEVLINSQELVPGDVVFLAAGDRVPADLRLLKINNLKIDEAALTGESEARKKHMHALKDNIILAERENMAFMGTLVAEGSGVGIVINTGLKTEIGKIAELVSTTQEDKTPLQIKLNALAFFLTKIILAVAVFIFILGLFSGHSFLEMFTTAIAVAVAAMPESLVLTVTVMLAISMQRILKTNALVKTLLGVEVLGSTTVVCVDKTGTLTEGNMEVTRLITEDLEIDTRSDIPTLDAKSAEEQLLLLRIGVLCNDGYITQQNEKNKINDLVVSGNLTERALLLAGHHVGLEQSALIKEQPRIDEIPFDSEKKFMMTLHNLDEQNNIIYLKGAPEKVLIFCNYVYSHHIKNHLELNEERRAKFVAAYEALSKEGLRVLAIGYKKIPAHIDAISDQAINDKIKNQLIYKKSESLTESKQAMKDLYTNFVLVGLVGMSDPLRVGVKETLELTAKAGLKTVMITGDNKFTAQKIATELGLDVKDGHLLDGSELEKISMTELVTRVKEINVYSRTTPEQKLKIVKAWQENGAVVAMTGDGINDTPALKQADIGLALGTGSDVAREVADVILLDNNFATILAAIKEGRIIFENIKKTILYFLSDSFTEVFIISFALLARLPLPLLASQIIWVNLIDDTFPALALSQDPVHKDVMRDKPVKKNHPLINLEMKSLIIIISLVISSFIILCFYLFWQHDNAKLDLARTIVFTIHGLDTLLYTFCLRDLSKPFWRTNLFSNKMLLFAIGLGFLLQIVVIYNGFLQKIFHTVPLGFWHWVLILAINAVVILVIELIKWLFIRFKWQSIKTRV